MYNDNVIIEKNYKIMMIKQALKENKNNLIMLLVLVAWGIISRLIPHPANFTAVGAVLLFSGFYFKKEWKIIAPLAVMFISDGILGFYNLKLMFTVYFCFFLYFVLGSYLKQNKLALRATGFSLLGSILFFAITNLAVWAFTPWYPHSAAGLLNCYIMALPFFFNSLAGDIFYTSVIFGAYTLAINYSKLGNYLLIKNK